MMTSDASEDCPREGRQIRQRVDRESDDRNHDQANDKTIEDAPRRRVAALYDISDLHATSVCSYGVKTFWDRQRRAPNAPSHPSRANTPPGFLVLRAVEAALHRAGAGVEETVVERNVRPVERADVGTGHLQVDARLGEVLEGEEGGARRTVGAGVGNGDHGAGPRRCSGDRGVGGLPVAEGDSGAGVGDAEHAVLQELAVNGVSAPQRPLASCGRSTGAGVDTPPRVSCPSRRWPRRRSEGLMNMPRWMPRRSARAWASSSR